MPVCWHLSFRLAVSFTSFLAWLVMDGARIVDLFGEFLLDLTGLFTLTDLFKVERKFIYR
jgi:hypothetical protein